MSKITEEPSEILNESSGVSVHEVLRQEIMEKDQYIYDLEL